MTIMVKHLTSNMVMFYFTHNRVTALLTFPKKQSTKEMEQKATTEKVKL